MKRTLGRAAALPLVALLLLGAVSTAQTKDVRTTPVRRVAEKARTYQGKDVRWWAARAVANRREANAARGEIKRLRHTIQYSLSIEESVLLATTAYPQMSEAAAWCIIRRESWDGTSDALKDWSPARAVNHTAIGSEHATGLYQFLPSTFRSTPYGKFSIWSPYVQSMAAGWMFAHGRAREWTDGCT